MDAQHQKESCCDAKFSITGGTKGNCYGNLKCHQPRQNIQENAFENIVFKMLAILFKPQCVKRGSVELIRSFCQLLFPFFNALI